MILHMLWSTSEDFPLCNRLFSEGLETYRASPHPETRKKGAPHKVRVFGQVNSDTDPDVMAKILIDVGKEIQSRSRP